MEPLGKALFDLFWTVIGKSYMSAPPLHLFIIRQMPNAYSDSTLRWKINEYTFRQQEATSTFLLSWPSTTWPLLLLDSRGRQVSTLAKCVSFVLNSSKQVDWLTDWLTGVLQWVAELLRNEALGLCLPTQQTKRKTVVGWFAKERKKHVNVNDAK